MSIPTPPKLTDSGQVESLTIDDLGIDTSRRFEEDRLLFDKALISDSKTVAEQTEADVTAPIIESEVSHLLGLTKATISWPIIRAPKGFSDQTKRLYVHEIIPQITSDERIETNLQRISSLIEKYKEEAKQKRERPLFSWEKKRDTKEIEAEGKKIGEMLQDISEMNKLFLDIKAERSRYKKG